MTTLDPMNSPPDARPSPQEPFSRPPDLGRKREIIRGVFDAHRPSYVVETGLYAGSGSCYQFASEAEVWCIDLDPANVRAAVDAGCVGIVGDSGYELPRLLEGGLPRGPALFWLDAHDIDEGEGCPLLAELAAIRDWEHAPSSVVLIDDVRLMGVIPGWPTVDQVLDAVSGMIPDPWGFAVADDILRLVPR